MKTYNLFFHCYLMFLCLEKLGIIQHFIQFFIYFEITCDNFFFVILMTAIISEKHIFLKSVAVSFISVEKYSSRLTFLTLNFCRMFER